MVARYSTSLFTLPSHAKIVVSLFLLCVIGGSLAFLSLDWSYDGLFLGLTFGSASFFLTLLSDLIVSHGLMKSRSIYNLRRCNGLSLFSFILWFASIFLGILLNFLLKNTSVWIKLFLLGFSAVLLLRLVVFSTTTFAGYKGVVLSSLLQPGLCLVALFLLYGFDVSFALYLSFSIPIIVVSAFLLTFFINKVGEKTFDAPPILLFKAFIASWVNDWNVPLEGIFEKIGKEQDVEASLLAFKNNNGMKAVVAVPSFHPGPFKNVGSSLMPCMIQTALENKFKCVASVPHGLFGHELDLASQRQNQKVLDKIVESMNFTVFNSEATRFVRTRRGAATASCQIFGDCALLTLTMAPETIEDLPPQLGSAIFYEAKKHGLSSAIIINAHNSINGPFNIDEAMGPLKDAALSSIRRALDCERVPFEVGAAKVVPKEFGLAEGMGQGGISVVVAGVGGRKAAYVTIDGNNMVSGLREKVLSELQEIGVEAGEVLTTDTHAVSGVVLTPRGYHPVGEVMDHNTLIDYVKQAVLSALGNMEPAKVAWRTITIPKVKVIGREQIYGMALLTEKAAQRAKKVALFSLSAVGLLLIVMLLVL